MFYITQHTVLDVWEHLSKRKLCICLGSGGCAWTWSWAGVGRERRAARAASEDVRHSRQIRAVQTVRAGWDGAPRQTGHSHRSLRKRSVWFVDILVSRSNVRVTWLVCWCFFKVGELMWHSWIFSRIVGKPWRNCRRSSWWLALDFLKMQI